MRGRRLAMASLLLLLLLGGAPQVRSAPGSGSSFVALVVGISCYDAATGVPDLPQCEEAAQQLAARLQTMPGSPQVTLAAHRVPLRSLLTAVENAAAQSGDVLVVAISCAGDADGIQASDARLALGDVLAPLRRHHARRLMLLLDAGGVGAADFDLGNGLSAVVPAADGAQQAWPVLLPETSGDDAGMVRFVSAATAGWWRAFDHHTGAYSGDLGNKGALSAEDLQLAADALARVAVPDVDGRRLLQKSVGNRVLHGVSGPLLTLLETQHSPVSFDDIRKQWGHQHFELFADVLQTLSSDSFRRLDAATQQAVAASIGQATGSAALHRVHDDLLRRGLLLLPHGEQDHWKTLLAQADGQIAIILPARQHVGIRGSRRLRTSPGSPDEASYYLSYGTYTGHWNDEPRMVVELRLQGTAVSGTCDGDYKGAWLRSDISGRYDPVARRVVARALGKIDTAGSHVTSHGKHMPGSDRDQPLQIELEGTVSADGSHVEGSWKGRAPTFSESGHWRVTK
jgi:hypothetical protein